MRKKHLKERQTMQKNHCSAIDKLVKGKEYVNKGKLWISLTKNYHH